MITPFNNLQATEISTELQKVYFVEPKHMNQLITNNAMFISGERGSGKTTILRHLEKLFNQNPAHEYLGVYFRFETAYMRSLYNQDISEEKNIRGFSQIITAIWSKLICETLLRIKEENAISYQKEQELCESVLKLFFNYDERWEKTLKSLRDIFEKTRMELMFGIINGDVPLCFSYAELLDHFALKLREEEIYSRTCVCILLDEYENLTYTQQRVINSFVKNHSYYLTYKICMRPEGFRTQLTLAEHEQLMPFHDYKLVQYIQEIMGTDAQIRELVQEMCCQRLKYFYESKGICVQESALDVENYLETLGKKEEIYSIGNMEQFREETILQIQSLAQCKVPEETFKEVTDIIDLYLLCLMLRKKHTFQTAYQEILSKGTIYKNMLHNYEQNIIYIILNYYERTKTFCGLDCIIKLSHNNARMILWILHYAFGELEGDEKAPYKKIKAKVQSAAINKVSREFFEDIKSIPTNGPQIQNLAYALGNLFKTFILDKQAKKFETNHFSIHTTGILTKEERSFMAMILKDATMWGVLIAEKANKSKNRGDMVYNDKDYILNPVLAPYFSISYRKKQKCELREDEIFHMLEPMPNTDLNKLAAKLSDESRQLSIWEMEEFN